MLLQGLPLPVVPRVVFTSDIFHEEQFPSPVIGGRVRDGGCSRLPHLDPGMIFVSIRYFFAKRMPSTQFFYNLYVVIGIKVLSVLWQCLHDFTVYPLLSAVAPHWVWRDWFGRGYLVALFSVCSVFSVVKALISLIKRVLSAFICVYLLWPPLQGPHRFWRDWVWRGRLNGFISVYPLLSVVKRIFLSLSYFSLFSVFSVISVV